MKRTILLAPFILAAALSLRAQSIGPSALNATGGTAVISGSWFDWSVGEMTMVSTFTSSGIILTQGLLQPAEQTSGIITGTPIAKELLVFPNPATSTVNVQYSAAMETTLSYRLMDMTGKTISNRTVAALPGKTIEQVNLLGLACATYMLEVTISSANTVPERSSHKIQKAK